MSTATEPKMPSPYKLEPGDRVLLRMTVMLASPDVESKVAAGIREVKSTWVPVTFVKREAYMVTFRLSGGTLMQFDADELITYRSLREL